MSEGGHRIAQDARDYKGHPIYGQWLSYRDFEQILLSLGASGSDVRRLWPFGLRRWFILWARFVNATCAYIVGGYLLWRLFS